MINSLEEYRDSLRPLKPRVFVDGRRIDNVADEPTLLPGINAIGVTYDMAADPALAPLMLAVEEETGRTVHRMTQIDRTPGRPAAQARSGAVDVPGKRLRATLFGARCLQRLVSGHQALRCRA